MNDLLQKTAPRQSLVAAVVLACASVQSPGSLLLQYKFDEGTGTTAADSAALPANATVSGTTWVADSPGAYAYSVSTVGMTTGGSSNAATRNRTQGNRV